ncbi:MAG: hypothetical protein FCKEOINB_00785 [Nitrosomonas sp.]|nr:hypothetical protein [Nitrosomonas sp.]
MKTGKYYIIVIATLISMYWATLVTLGENLCAI